MDSDKQKVRGKRRNERKHVKRYDGRERYNGGEKIWWRRKDIKEEKRDGGGEKTWWRRNI